MHYTILQKRLPLLLLLIVISVLTYIYLHLNPVSASSLPHTPSIAIPPVTATDHSKGPSNAPITIVEYSDFECPSCQLFQPTIQQVLHHYSSNILWVVRPYPLPQHRNAEKEAEAVECAGEIGGNTAYWKLSDILFSQVQLTENGTGFPLNKLITVAMQIGLPQKTFNQCLNSGKYYKKIQQTIADAENAGIYQLPSTVVIDAIGQTQLITSNQPYTTYQTIIDQALPH